MLSPELRPKLKGLARADSVAFDWHKWGQVPYDAGCLLVREGDQLRQTFASDAAYLSRAETGLAAGAWWPCDYGPDLSRGFRALKVWFALKTYGTEAIGHVIDRTCQLARYLSDLVVAHPELELLAPTQLNIVCFGFRTPGLADVNAAIVEALHLRGRVAPSVTRLAGRNVIRAAIVNHRTDEQDISALVAEVVTVGRSLIRKSAKVERFPDVA